MNDDQFYLHWGRIADDPIEPLDALGRTMTAGGTVPLATVDAERAWFLIYSERCYSIDAPLA